ncbi:alpha/beta hydrolase [Mucilaginibacter agri]|uniref:Alpha/beta hydrolase n=1 Tax=Mucilaginibacter agri TaxID=2695265 RepID=A0A966DTW4_9SPHI|nr:alpha/beta hydrolase [Mucilaginibacter agri]NCD71723.1 alpha/beta hydrolase [Mucilaginibacter agri]
MNIGIRQNKSLEIKRERGIGAYTAVNAEGLWPAFENDLVILVHGFNNDRKSAQGVYDKLLSNYRNSGVPERYLKRIVPFFWPAYRDWVIKGASYSTMIGDTIAMSFKLAEYLNISFLNNRRLQITFIAHSLGCRLVLEAMTKILTPQIQNVKHTCLLAAAVPISLFGKPSGNLYPLTNTSLKFSGIASRADWTLATLFRLGGLLSADGTASRAVGFDGKPEHLWTDGCEHLRIGHTRYWGNMQVAQFVAGKINMPVARSIRRNDLFANEFSINTIGKREIGE